MRESGDEIPHGYSKDAPDDPYKSAVSICIDVHVRKKEYEDNIPQ